MCFQQRFKTQLDQQSTLEEKLRCMDFIVDDLTIVMDDVVPCFPPEYIYILFVTQ